MLLTYADPIDRWLRDVSFVGAFTRKAMESDMADTTPMPASGDPARKGDADGVNVDHPSGRATPGESGGGSYPTGSDAGHERGDSAHFDGGQSEKGYHGGGQAGEDGPLTNNATTRGSDDYRDQGDAAAGPGPGGPAQMPHAEQTRTIDAGGRTFDVVETSGTAIAEEGGNVGRAGQHDSDPEAPGAG